MTAWPHIYIHVPFCGRRCSYCDFAIAVRREVPAVEYNDAIMAELVTRGISALEAPLRSIYLGGGTPSKLGGTGVEHLLHRLAELAGMHRFSTAPDELEITLEANPEDVDEAAAAAWVAAGVNRVSLGVQSFDSAVLDWMHRGHGPDRPLEAVRILRAAGIQEMSADLIFAVPENLNRSWTNDLDWVLELDVEHLSLYGLTVEPHTPLGRWTARGEVAEAPEERYEREFLEADARLSAAGFHHYEVSNYAKPGKRARHNSAYWSGAPYLGLGPSAHGFDGRERRWNASAYADWLRRVQGGADPVEGREDVAGDAEARKAERVYLGLRTSDGLTLTNYDGPTLINDGPTPTNDGLTLTNDGLSLTNAQLARVQSWLANGWATLEGNRLRLTPSGWLRLDALAVTLLN